MFGIKIQTNTDKKLTQLQNLLMRSFSNVKNDTQKLIQWMNYVHQKKSRTGKREKKAKIRAFIHTKKTRGHQKDSGHLLFI